MASLLAAQVQYLKGVGPRRAEVLAKLGVRTGLDLLYHLPHRYEDATTVDPIGELKVGQDATVIGRVVAKGVTPTRRRLRIFQAVLRDDTGRIECAWPGQPWLDRSIRKGDLLLVSGPVRFYHGPSLQPRQHTVLERGAQRSSRGGGGPPPGRETPPDGEATPDGEARGGRIFPIYPLTQGITNRQLQAIVGRNLSRLLSDLGERDPLPPAWLRGMSLPPLARALETLHRPRALARVDAAQRRLAFEELFFLQLLHARARERTRRASDGFAHDAPPRLTQALIASLPFRLTGAQLRAWRAIEEDMSQRWPMSRLLQGDVGSGKTVVAALALLKAVENGRQAAIMAPTVLLAEQHQRTLSELLAPLDVEPVLLASSLGAGERGEVLARIADGRARVVVGTHALIQESVKFRALGLAVVDEQHRFGVEQRRSLRRGRTDALVMTATPIPRSLALIMYGDLDLTLIDELPPGRRPVRTAVRGPDRRDAVFEFVRGQLSEGRQAYVVYPIIEESETSDLRAATVMFERLRERFPGFALGLLHGRLSVAEKEAAMRAFIDGKTQLLVATTVIEVGIDVPNATVMVIEEAERFGLAQLHQLRGRVGRGGEQSYCIAFHSGPGTPDRLEAFASISDGFELAERDLKLRGQGDLFGREQHGAPMLKFASLDRDLDLLDHARRLAGEIAGRDPELRSPAHRGLRRQLESRYAQREALYEVG